MFLQHYTVSANAQVSKFSVFLKESGEFFPLCSPKNFTECVKCHVYRQQVIFFIKFGVEDLQHALKSGFYSNATIKTLYKARIMLMYCFNAVAVSQSL